MRMRYALILALATSVATPGARGEPWTSGVPASGRLESVVLRDGDPIGLDVSEFVRDGDRLLVRTRTDIAVEVLLVTVYRFHAEVEEEWVDGRLVALHTRANDDGTRTTLDLRSDGRDQPAVVQVSDRGSPIIAPAEVMPSSFWNPATVGHTDFVDSLTGKSFEVTVKPQGEESLEIGGRRVAARRFAMRGGLDRDLWYDASGQLLKIEFDAEDGSRIAILRKSM